MIVQSFANSDHPNVYASSGLEIPLSIDNVIIESNGCDAMDCDLLYKSTQNIYGVEWYRSQV